MEFELLMSDSSLPEISTPYVPPLRTVPGVVVVVVVLNYYKKYSKFQYKLEIPYKYTVVLYSYIGGHRMVKIK